MWNYYKQHGRDNLPWRKTRDPYRILVSEVMLQQTQVERVIPYYTAFIRRWPTARSLKRAPLSDVLRAWQGLGYNRRAKMLHEAAKVFPRFDLVTRSNLVARLEELPGVGPYTARAVAAFAWNMGVVFTETNIRTAVMRHFFPQKESVHDREILAVLEKSLPMGRAREWYLALMDYGAALKRAGVRTNARVKGYRKQTRFDGSYRQARGAVLRALAKGPKRGKELGRILGDDRESQVKGAIASLTKEGMITLRRGKFGLAG